MKSSLKMILAFAAGITTTDALAVRYTDSWSPPALITTSLNSAGDWLGANQQFLTPGNWRTYNFALDAEYAFNNWTGSADKRGGFLQFGNDASVVNYPQGFAANFQGGNIFRYFTFSGTGLTRGGIFYVLQPGTQAELTFGNNVWFKHNEILSSANTAQGGAIWVHSYSPAQGVVSQRPGAQPRTGYWDFGNGLVVEENYVTGTGNAGGTDIIGNTGNNDAAANAWLASLYQAVSGGAVFSAAVAKGNDGSRMEWTIGGNASFKDNKAEVTAGSNSAIGGAIAKFTGGLLHLNPNYHAHQIWTVGSASFSGNRSVGSTSSGSNAFGGAIYDALVAYMSAQSQSTAYSTLSFTGATNWSGNYALAKSDFGTAAGGAIFQHTLTGIELADRKPDITHRIDFAEKATFTNNHAANTSAVGGYAFGGAIAVDIDWNGDLNASATNPVLQMNFNKGASFSDNRATARNKAAGGAVSFDNLLSSPNGKDLSKIIFYSTFNGDTSFVNNRALSDVDAAGGAMFIQRSNVSFNIAKGQTLEFRDNYTAKLNGSDKLWNSMHFSGNGVSGAIVNVDIAAGGKFINYDPITTQDDYTPKRHYAQLNITGNGYVELWGDNTGYTGTLSVDPEIFAFYFDAADKSGRDIADFSAAKVVLAGNMIYRPKVSEAWLGRLSTNGGNLTLSGDVKFEPFELSKLPVGIHTYMDNYNVGMIGFDSALSSVTFNAGSTVINLKRNLAGYNGWNALADAYRMDDFLTEAQRLQLDELYRTGNVTPEIEALAQLLGWRGGSGGGGGGSGATNIGTEGYGALRQAAKSMFGRQISMQQLDQRAIGRKPMEKAVWFDLGYGMINKSSGKTPGYSFNPLSLTAGADINLKDGKTNIGAAFSYMTGTAKAKASYRQRNNLSAIIVGGYAQHDFEDFYVAGHTGFMVANNKLSNNSSLLNTSSNYNSIDIFVNAEAGLKPFDYEKIMLQPYVGVEYLRMYNGAINEKGTGGARHIGEMTWNVVETPIGFRLWRSFDYEGFILRPTVDLAYAPTLGQTKATSDAYFLGNRSTNWQAQSYLAGRHSVRGLLSLGVTQPDSPSLFRISYGIDYRGDLTAHQIDLSYRYTF